MKTLIWLDDMRDPNDVRMDWLAYSPIGREVEVIWVKDYFQFKKWLMKMDCQMEFVLIMIWVKILPADMSVLNG